MPWINHPACQEGPVSLIRWLRYYVGEWMAAKGSSMSDRALFPNRCPECGAAMRDGCDFCDHIPF